MDKEIADPNRQGKYIRWIPYVEESKMQYLYPINETDVFRRSAMTESRSHSLVADSQANPNIYTQLYEKRLVDKGKSNISMLSTTKKSYTRKLIIYAAINLLFILLNSITGQFGELDVFRHYI